MLGREGRAHLDQEPGGCCLGPPSVGAGEMPAGPRVAVLVPLSTGGCSWPRGDPLGGTGSSEQGVTGDVLGQLPSEAPAHLHSHRRMDPSGFAATEAT